MQKPINEVNPACEKYGTTTYFDQKKREFVDDHLPVFRRNIDVRSQRYVHNRQSKTQKPFPARLIKPDLPIFGISTFCKKFFVVQQF